jgi:hypothetical protein
MSGAATGRVGEKIFLLAAFADVHAITLAQGVVLGGTKLGLGGKTCWL